MSNDKSEVKISQWLRFMVREHHATHLHNDFRLEMVGILISWALREGPNLNPSVSYPAVRVGDHSLAGLWCDGRIPEGRYGAGPFKRWDLGAYRVIGHTDPVVALESGVLQIEMRGFRLKGQFLMQQLGKSKDWLITKMQDEYVDKEWRHVPMDAREADRFCRRTTLADLEEEGQIPFGF